VKRLGVVAALALAACQPRTEMMIGVATDVRAPDILDNVELVVTRLSDGMPEIMQQWDITGIPNEPFNLPGSYGIYSADGTEPKVQIEVVGLKNGKSVVTRHAILSLVSNRTLFVRMGLTAGCINKNDCGPTETCVEGQCRERLIDSRQLPDFVQVLVNELTCDSGTHYIDTATGDPMPFSADAMNCPSSLCSEGTCFKPPVDDGGTTFEPTDMAVGDDMTTAPDMTADLMPAMLTCPGDVLGTTAQMMFSTTGVSGLVIDPATGSPIWMDSMSGDIRIGDPCTAGSSQLIANASTPQAPLIAGGLLFFSGTGSLFRTPITPGSTPMPMFDSGPIGYLAADATKLYYWSTTTLESAMIGGTTINPLGMADPASPLVAVGGNFAFWYDKQSALDLSAVPAVMKVDLSSTFTPVVVATVTNGLGIVSDNTNVYWTDSATGLSMQPIAGGTTQNILPAATLNNSGGRLLIGPNHLIVTTATGEGDLILEVPPTPNATPTALATNTSLDTTISFPKIGVGQHGVYWVDSAQQIWRAPALP
jgi:hypothetical protein